MIFSVKTIFNHVSYFIEQTTTNTLSFFKYHQKKKLKFSGKFGFYLFLQKKNFTKKKKPFVVKMYMTSNKLFNTNRTTYVTDIFDRHRHLFLSINNNNR